MSAGEVGGVAGFHGHLDLFDASPDPQQPRGQVAGALGIAKESIPEVLSD